VRIGRLTRLIEASATGCVSSRDRLVELLYAEFYRMVGHHMRNERAGHSLGATALVSETYLRLSRGWEGGGRFSDRRAFFGAASLAMRRVLIEHARAKQAKKRGGPTARRIGAVELNAIAASERLSPEDFLALDDAIRRLDEVDGRAASVTRLRFFAGLGVDTVADLLEVSPRTVKRDWEFARAWLRDRLNDGACE